MAEFYKPLNSDDFNLAPAIFVPFNGIPKDKPIPRDRPEKLKRILEDLEKHQDAVRRNMMYLAVLQKEKLLSDAREALEKERATAPLSSHSETENQSPDDPELDREIKALLESINEPALRGTSGKEYEYQDSDFDPPVTDDPPAPAQRVPVTDAEGDAAMTGMNTTTTTNNNNSSTPTKRNIPYELSTAIQQLVLGTVSELESYDAHAATTKEYYQRALERHNAREGLVGGTDAGTTTAPTATTLPATPAAPAKPTPPAGAPTGPSMDRRPGGILRHTSGEIRVDAEALKRMAREEEEEGGFASVSSAGVEQGPQGQGNTKVDGGRDPRRRTSVQFAAVEGWKGARRGGARGGDRDLWRR